MLIVTEPTTGSVELVSLAQPLLLSFVVAAAAGYVATLWNVLRRARSGQLRRADIRLPGFQLLWDSATGAYTGRTLVGSFTIEVTGSQPASGSEPSTESGPKSVAELAEVARSAARQMDEALIELQSTLAARHDAVNALEQRLVELHGDEGALESRLQVLESVEPEVAKVFKTIVAEDLDAREQRGARRDLWMFVAGSLVTVVVSAVFFAIA